MTKNLMRNRYISQSKIDKIKTRRSIFPVNWSRKMTLNASYITPIMCKRVVPGTTYNLNMDAFIRLNTQKISPIDNLVVETFFFYGPDRICWDNEKYFMGEEKDPNNRTDYLIPQIEIPAAANTAGSLFNTLSASRIGKKVKVVATPFTLHNLIHNEYFRDADCESPKIVDKSDADKVYTDYDIYRIHKSRDYYTNSTRDITAGNTVTLPLGTTAPVVGNGKALGLTTGDPARNLFLGTHQITNNAMKYFATATWPEDLTTLPPAAGATMATTTTAANQNVALGVSQYGNMSGLRADLSAATASTLPALRNAIMTEEYLEALNRGGNKYKNIMENIYGVDIADGTIQRPKYLGGTRTPLYTNPIYQTSETTATSPQGNITGNGVAGESANIINASFPEFGYVLGYMVVKAIPQYQQGLDKFWNERDFLDLYNPYYINASDQPIKESEIFLHDYDETLSDGTLANDRIFGYIGRYDDLRYFKNEIAGELNSEYNLTLDYWHYAEKFENAPVNNASFMQDKTYEILDRSLSVVWEDEQQTIKAPQLVADIEFNGAVTIPIPVHAVPKISALI